MKKIYALLIIITMLMTACQPTPEKEIVVGKDDDKLDKKIESIPAPIIDTGHMLQK